MEKQLGPETSMYIFTYLVFCKLSVMHVYRNRSSRARVPMPVASCIMNVARITIAGRPGIDCKSVQEAIRKRFSSADFAELQEMALSITLRQGPRLHPSESLSSGASTSGIESLNGSKGNDENANVPSESRASKKKNENSTPKNKPRVARKKAKGVTFQNTKKKENKPERKTKKKNVLRETQNTPDSDSESEWDESDMPLRNDDSTDKEIADTCQPSCSSSDENF